MDRAALEAARAGDEHAFEALTTPYLRELHVHCYRMLGSLVDAEDLLQETLTAAWRGLEGFAERSSLRTWLYRIATNRCLNAIRDDNRHRPAQPTPPFDPPEPTRRNEVTWLQPYPDAWLVEHMADTTFGPADRYRARESIELAFIVALQCLPPRQTAALVLCDVLAFSTSEVATMLDTPPTTVKGLLQRARATLDRDRPVTTSEPPPDAGSREEQEIASRFAAAFSADDVEGVVALLTEDAWLTMPPAPHEYLGPQPIAGFLHASARWRNGSRIRLVSTRANGQPAFVTYIADTGEPVGVIVLTVCESRIRTITRFIDGALSARFDTNAFPR